MKENNSKAFLLILLGALTAFGPLVTDMYLQIRQWYNSDSHQV